MTVMGGNRKDVSARNPGTNRAFDYHFDEMSGTVEYDAVIVGAGPSGIGAAARLALDLNVTNVLLVERGADVGGTWYWNTYDGAGCDVPPRLYSFSFAQKQHWSRFMAGQVEMHTYLRDVAHQYGLPSKTKFSTEVYGVQWVEDGAKWNVKYRSVDGKTHGTTTARIVVNCSGALSVPRDCDVDGWQEFAGPLFHSARWDSSVDLTGKNVVVLGNGCSATQIVPSIARRVKSVTQIVRAKHWYAPTPEDPARFPLVRWLEQNVPGFTRFERALFAVLIDVHFIQAWNKEGRAARQRFADTSLKYIKTVAPERYHPLLIPTQDELQVACKRRIFDDAYLPSLNRDNVELTNDPAVRIGKDTVTLRSGRVLPADVIVLASGFKTADTNVQMSVVGRNGKELNQLWAKQGAPQAYRSTMVHDFPNLFLIWGPNAVTGHYSAIFTIEASTRLMTTVLRPIFNEVGSKDSAGKAVEVTADAQEKEGAMIEHQMRGLIYSSGCKGWYTNDAGRVSTLYPGFQLTFAWRSDHPIVSDLHYTGLRTSASSSWGYGKRLASA